MTIPANATSFRGIVLPQAVKPKAPVQPRFAANSNTDGSESDAKQILTYVEPKPTPGLQRVMLKLNRHFMMKDVRLDISKADIAKLRNIPKNAGNILVGTHPDNMDGILLMSLYDIARRLPAAIFMASDAMMERYKLVVPVLSRLGCVPVKRGAKNPEAIEYMTKQISEGKWGGIFPEGTVYFSREVMPMEYGAAKIAMEAALKAMERQDDRPVLMTPFAHAYVYEDKKEMERNLLKALGELESLPQLFGRPQQGTRTQRMYGVAEKILEHKAISNGVFTKPTAEWQAMDMYQRAAFLKNRLIDELETRYLGHTTKQVDRRRVIKVQMLMYEKLSEVTGDKKAKGKKGAPSEAEKALRADLKKALDAIFLLPYSPGYLEKYDDWELRSEYLRRFRDSMGLSFEAFGKRRAVFKVLPSIDMRAHAEKYKALGENEDAKKRYLFDLIEEVRQMIQKGVDEIVKEENAGLPPLSQVSGENG